MIDLHWHWEDLLRLALALIMGAAIGFERELHDKPAGLKTISIVTLAGCLLALLSVRLGEIASGGTERVDISRLAAGVVTGIGFIGAGTIIQSRGRVEGVTTAAVIWIMSAVGMALGAGFYSLAGLAYLCGWIGLSLDPLGIWLMRRFNLPQKVQQGEAEEQDVKYRPFGLTEDDFEPEGKIVQPGGTRQALQKRPENHEP